MDFKRVSLFGGAFAVELPKAFADVSSIRQIPDHQEVYLDTQGYTNIIFEILERVSKDVAETDEDALQYHVHDIVSTETDEVKTWDGGPVIITKLTDTPVYTRFISQHVDRNAQGRQSKEDFTGTLLILARLEAQNTDLLIAVNVPHIPGEYERNDIDLAEGRLGNLIEDGIAIRKRILETFEIKDWTVFASEDNA